MSTASIVFAHETLTPVTQPNARSIQLLCEELYENAVAVPSNYVGGVYGHLALVLPPDAYLALPDTIPWVTPVQPEPLPSIPVDATEGQVEAICCIYDRAVINFAQFTFVQNTLKQQIIKAVPSIYMKELSHSLWGYGKVTPREMLDYLTSKYGKATHKELDENMDILQSDWDPTQSLHVLWSRVHECRVFAEKAGDPISEVSAIRAIVATLTKTGVFDDAVREWRRKFPLTHYPLEICQDHFDKANTERLRKHTTASPACTNTVRTPTLETPHGFAYCWSHGLTRNLQHTSVTCQNPQPGHNTAATIGNLLGGCNTIQRRTNERAIYRRPSRKSPSEH